MKRLNSAFLISGLCVLLLWGCASSEKSLYQNTHRSNLGVTWQAYVAERVPVLLESRYSFRIRVNQADSDYILIETEWMPREVYGNEAEAGVTLAHNRVIVEGRSRGRVSTETPEENRPSVTYVFETTYEFAPGAEKSQVDIGPELRRYINEIETELKRVLEIRI
jgi:hypothetical protein